jgi:hypothetical protein
MFHNQALLFSCTLLSIVMFYLLFYLLLRFIIIRMYHVVYADDGGKDYALSIFVLSIFVISRGSQSFTYFTALLFDHIFLLSFCY